MNGVFRVVEADDPKLAIDLDPPVAAPRIARDPILDLLVQGVVGPVPYIMPAVHAQGVRVGGGDGINLVKRVVELAVGLRDPVFVVVKTDHELSVAVEYDGLEFVHVHCDEKSLINALVLAGRDPGMQYLCGPVYLVLLFDVARPFFGHWTRW